MSRDNQTLHSLAWLSWVSATLVALSATRNPFYLLLILLCVAVVSASALNIASAQQDQTSSGLQPIRLSPLRFGLLVTPLGALFNALMVRAGDTTVLSIPSAWPIVGGAAITLEALVFGALNGVMITGFFAAFAVLNTVVPARALVRRVPRAFYSAAVVTSIALTYIPFTLRQFEQVREAQAVRGHEMRRLRDWLPLFMPLLVGGMERALQLAESMAARGFASADAETLGATDQAAVLTGLLALAAGWLLNTMWGHQVAGPLMMLAGIAILALALRAVGRRAPHTPYRREAWRARDWVTVLASVVVVVAMFVPLPGLSRASLIFYPYPALSAPELDLSIVALLMCLLAPALMLGLPRR